MADNVKQQETEKPVVVAGEQPVKLDAQGSKTEDTSIKTGVHLPASSIETKLPEKNEPKQIALVLKESVHGVSDKQIEPSAHVEIVEKTEEIRNIEDKKFISKPVLEPKKPTEAKPSELAAKSTTSHGGNVSDIPTKLKPPDAESSTKPSDKLISEMLEAKKPSSTKLPDLAIKSITSHGSNVTDVLTELPPVAEYSKKPLEQPLHSSEISIKGKELVRKMSIGPVFFGSSNERPSGISISIPKKSSKLLSEATRPMKPKGINVHKKSTSDLNFRTNKLSLLEKEDMRAFNFFTNSPMSHLPIESPKEPTMSHLPQDVGKGDVGTVPTSIDPGIKSNKQNCFTKCLTRIGGIFDKI